MNMGNIPWATIIAALVLGPYLMMRQRIKPTVSIPLGLMLIFVVLRLVTVFLDAYTWGQVWVTHLKMAQDVVLAWAVARLVFWLVMELPARWFQSIPRIPKITRDFILFISFAALLFIVLRMRSNVNLASLLTTSAVLTVVIGLAAQATLSNFFSGLILQAERPFRIGDWVQIGEHEGRVVGISWKSTQILTRLQVLIIIPNSEMAANIFSNFSKPTRKKIAQIFLGVEYGAAPNDVRRVVTDVLAQHPKILKQPRPIIRLVAFGDFAITYEIRFWHNNYTHEPQIIADINNQLWYALRRNRIKIPFPIRDVQHAHIERRHHHKEAAAMRRDFERLFAQVPVLMPLTDQQRADLAAEVDIEVYGRGEWVFTQGDPGDSMYVICAGECDVVQQGAGERNTVIGTLGRGEFFGEMGLLTGEKRSASIVATCDTTLIKIDKDKFSSILIANPLISDQIGQMVAKRQANQALHADQGGTPSQTSQHLVSKIRQFFRL